jgi:hypothetical protein
MDASILTVTVPAPQLLTTLANVKAELGITNTASDALLTRYISVASDSVAVYCRRSFLQQSYQETIRASPFIDSASMVNQPYFLILRGGLPLISISQLILDADIAGTGPLVEGIDFEVDYEAGQIFRLWSDLRMRWFFRMVQITYIAGFAPTIQSIGSGTGEADGSSRVASGGGSDGEADGQASVSGAGASIWASDAGKNFPLPATIEQATIDLVRAAWFARTRDPLLRSENAQGIYSASWNLGDPNFPPTVQALLDPYVLTRFW